PRRRTWRRACGIVATRLASKSDQVMLVPLEDIPEYSFASRWAPDRLFDELNSTVDSLPPAERRITCQPLPPLPPSRKYTMSPVSLIDGNMLLLVLLVID